MLVPRLVIAAPHSGAGKTTVATGLMAALTKRIRVGAAKVGPDFIDPSYHALATGRPSRNLDAWICGEDAVTPVAAKAAGGADLLIVEGVMGLFDGAADDGHTASTAHIARNRVSAASWLSKFSSRSGCGWSWKACRVARSASSAFASWPAFISPNATLMV